LDVLELDESQKAKSNSNSGIQTGPTSHWMLIRRTKHEPIIKLIA